MRQNRKITKEIKLQEMWKTMTLSIESQMDRKRRNAQSEFYDILDFIWGKGWNGNDILERTSFVRTNEYVNIEYKYPVRGDLFFRVQASPLTSKLMLQSFRFLAHITIFSYDQKARKSQLYYKMLIVPTCDVRISFKEKLCDDIAFLEFSLSVLSINFTQITCEETFVLHINSKFKEIT